MHPRGFCGIPPPQEMLYPKGDYKSFLSHICGEPGLFHVWYCKQKLSSRNSVCRESEPKFHTFLSKSLILHGKPKSTNQHTTQPYVHTLISVNKLTSVQLLLCKTRCAKSLACNRVTQNTLSECDRGLLPKQNYYRGYFEVNIHIVKCVWGPLAERKPRLLFSPNYRILAWERGL